MNDIFDEIKNQRNYSVARSTDWYKRKIKSLGGKDVQAKYALENAGEKLTSSLEVGKMFLFMYDPKYKATLPMYDRFPLVIPFSRDATSFTGLNFHYLPLGARMVLLNKLFLFANNNKLDGSTRLKITWSLLSNMAKFPEVQPCVKKYLYGHVQTRFMQLDASEWKTAVLLPYEKFVYKP